MLKKLKTSNEYFNATFVYILANGIGQGTTLLANVFFTRYMSQNDYGLYSNYYSYVAILVPFAGMNLYFGLANAYMDYKEDIHKIRSSVLLLSVIGFFITSLVAAVIYRTIGMTVPVLCVILALAHAYGFFLVNYFIQSMNMENHFIAKGVMLAVPNVLQAVLAGVAVMICNTYISRAVGATTGVLSCGVIASIIILRDSVPKVNKEWWAYVLRISLPAIIGSVSAMIMQQCDKVMITSLIGAETTAVYALIYNIGYILYAVQQATSGAWQAWIYGTLDKKAYGNIPDVQKWYLFFMLVITTVLYMVAPEIIKILSPSNYWHFDYVVPFIIGSYLMVMYSMNMSVIQYAKRTDVTSIIVVFAAVLNIGLNYVLIPTHGGIGAAYTSVASYLFIYIVSSLYLRMKRNYQYKANHYLVTFALVVMMGKVFYFVKDNASIRYVMFICVLMAECAYAYLRKNEIVKMFGGKVF